MSDEIDELLSQMEKDEEIRKLEDQKYFADQNKKYKELQTKLTRLKEQNKKQMDIIINILDKLILNKNTVDKTLEKAVEGDDATIPDATIPDATNTSDVDLLSKVTGFLNRIKDSNILNKNLSEDIQEKVKVDDKDLKINIIDDAHSNQLQLQEKKGESSTSSFGKNLIEKIDDKIIIKKPSAGAQIICNDSID